MRGSPQYVLGRPEMEQQQQQHPHQQTTTVTNSIRPTYGAYSSNTLPRGPYLQYKYSSEDGHQHQNATHHPRLLGVPPADQQHSSHQQQLLLHQYRRQQLSLATKYATIANAKSTSHQHRQHPQPEPQLIRDNNNLRVSRYPMTTTECNRTQTLERYQCNRSNPSPDNPIKGRSLSSTVKLAAPPAHPVHLSSSSSRSQSNLNANMSELNSGRSRTGGIPSVRENSSMPNYGMQRSQSSASVLFPHPPPSHPHHHLHSLSPANQYSADFSANRPPTREGQQSEVAPLLTYQSLPRTGTSLSHLSPVSGFNYATLNNHHHHHHQRRQQLPPNGTTGLRLGSGGQRMDSSASMFNVNYAGTDARNDSSSAASSTPIVVSGGHQQRLFIASPPSSRLGSIGQGTASSSTSASLSSLAQVTEKRSQYLNGLLSSNNHLLMDWHRELAANGMSSHQNQAKTARHSSSSVSSSVGSMHTVGSQLANGENPLRRPSTASSYNSTTDVSFVTLDEVLRVYPEGLFESEGWALLCQSVQALQDLFLAGESFIL